MVQAVRLIVLPPSKNKNQKSIKSTMPRMLQSRKRTGKNSMVARGVPASPIAHGFDCRSVKNVMAT